MSPVDVAIRGLLVRQHGIASRAELLAGGVTSAAISRRLASGDLRPVVPGVYRSGHTAVTDELRLRAVRLRIGPESVIAGHWAAWWLGLTGPATGPVTVIVPPGHSRPQWKGVLTRRHELGREDRILVRGVLVTTRARTVLDCAARPDGELIRDVALQRGTTVASMRATLERMSPAHGSPAARRLVTAAESGGVSHPERLLLRALRRAHATGWQAGVHVVTGAGPFWLDLAVVSLRLAVEIDGWTVHSAVGAFHSDRERQNALVAAGWTVYRYTPRRLADELDTVVTEIRLAQARLTARATSRTVRFEVGEGPAR